MLSCSYFHTLRVLSFMVCTSMLSFFLFFELTLMLIGQETPLIYHPPLVIASLLVHLWALGKTKNNLLWPTLALELNIVPLHIPHLNSFGAVGSSRIWVSSHPLPPLSSYCHYSQLYVIGKWGNHLWPLHRKRPPNFN